MAAMPTPPDETPQTPPEDAPQTPPGEGREWWRGWLPRRREAPEPAAGARPPGATPHGDGPEADQPTEVIPPPPKADGPAKLRRERRRLLASREEADYLLGGLAFELYRRDQLGEEVMRRKAGEVVLLDETVRDIDARLGAERGAAGEAVAGDVVHARRAPAPLLAIAVDLAEAGVDVAHRLVE